jgi:hypothetical protein
MSTENQQEKDEELQQKLGRSIIFLFSAAAIVFILFMILLNFNFSNSNKTLEEKKSLLKEGSKADQVELWEAPIPESIPDTAQKINCTLWKGAHCTHFKISWS